MLGVKLLSEIRSIQRDSAAQMLRFEVLTGFLEIESCLQFLFKGCLQCRGDCVRHLSLLSKISHCLNVTGKGRFGIRVNQERFVSASDSKRCWLS